MVVLGLLAGLVVLGARVVDEQECGTIGDCLSNGFSALLLGSLLAPAVVLVGMLLLRFPRRDLLVSALLVVAPQLLWQPVEFLAALNPVPGTDWTLWVVAEALLVITAWLLVRSAPTHPVLRVLPLLLVVAVGFALVTVEDGLERRRTIEEVGAAPVTLRLVDLGKDFEVRSVYASPRGYVSVSYSGKVAGTHAMPKVLLAPLAAAGTPCEAAAVAGPLGFDAQACSGDSFLTTGSRHTAVGVTRGDTVLVASISTDDALDAGWVRGQLLAAPEVSADELVP
ncbi:hypothetical protein GCM10028820_30640 [Tessaracoccus terricola]